MRRIRRDPDWNACDAACGDWGQQQRTVVCQRAGDDGPGDISFRVEQLRRTGDAEPLLVRAALERLRLGSRVPRASDLVLFLT